MLHFFSVYSFETRERLNKMKKRIVGNINFARSEIEFSFEIRLIRYEQSWSTLSAIVYIEKKI